MRLKDDNKINLIFEATLGLIQNTGIAGLTMSGLAKRAGMATGTLYIYFKNKEDLFHKLFLHLREESNRRFMQGFSSNESFPNSIKKVWMNYLKHRIENHEESVFLEQYYRSPYITKNHKQLAEDMKKPVHDLIQLGKNQDFIRTDIDNEMLFLIMLGFIRELADEHVNNVYKLNNQRIEKAFQLSWESIKK